MVNIMPIKFWNEKTHNNKKSEKSQGFLFPHLLTFSTIHKILFMFSVLCLISYKTE